MCGEIATEFLHLTAGNFEQYLASDDTLVLFFNDFLSLPLSSSFVLDENQSFPEALLYNQETGVFEVVSEAAECVSRRIKSVLHCSKTQLLTNDPTLQARSPPIDNRYTVCCLDKEQGFQWIMKERFPLFIQSDCYFEYRLAKLLSQWDPDLCIQKRDGDVFQTTHSVTRPPSSSQSNNTNVLKALTCSYAQEKCSTKQGSVRCVPSSGQEGHRKHINPTCCASSRCISCFPDPEDPCMLSSSSSSSSNLNSEKTQEPQSPETDLSLYFTEPSTEEECLRDSNTQSFESNNIPLEDLAAKVVKQVLKDAVEMMDGCSQRNTSDCFSRSKDRINRFTDADGSFKSEVYSVVEGKERLEEEKERDQEGKTGSGEEEQAEGDEEKKKGVWNRGPDKENVPDVCYHGACFRGSRRGLNEFKEFLQGTSGEKLLHLWMDIERLKATQRREQKNRHLVLMRSRYLLSSSQSSLHVELLSTLGLTTSPCWTEEKLQLVQPCLTEALLFYWAPRFWTSQCVQEDSDESTLGLWTERHLRPPSGIDPYPRCITLPPVRPDTCLPRSSHTARTQLCPSSSSSSPVLGSRRMEWMLQALFGDSRAGLYFTHFCEQSGNQLWENAVSFWTDLQHYHQLFYRDGLDPYTVQRHAQLLYSTYLSSSARRSIGVDEEARREVYDRLMPAFEELFDGVEEHTLTLLLEPWTLLVTRDKESYQKVCVQEEVRQLASEEYRELQSLYEEAELRLRQVEQYKSTPPPPSPSPSEGPQEHDPWSNVSPCYRGYRLGSLLRHREEIRHFMSFLQHQDASIHLTCWLDLDQYRRTPQKDKAVRQERSSHITTKYLNRKYFFGPDSPASAEQQNDIMRLAGGPERLKRERLSNPVVVEIQNIVRSHIEKTWLPLFLATAEFTERQKRKPQAADRFSEQVYRRHRKRRQAWKQTGGLWMSSSKEILVFRRVLLNPVTCLQFQHFVSMKGDFLENDVLFWLEVQRYKDLCHSHSDEATIQQKISTIINCFINSSMPPALQIDIPPEQAQHILENRNELGPYIFREAQMTVFSELLKLWPQFQALKISLQEEQLLPLLEEKRVKHRARLQRRRRREDEEEEERRAQEELERQESSFTEEEEEEVDGERERELTSRQSRTLYSPTQQMSWSYSKYMAALKREEVLLRRQSQLDASSSTASDSSSGRSLKSAGSKQPSAARRLYSQSKYTTGGNGEM